MIEHNQIEQRTAGGPVAALVAEAPEIAAGRATNRVIGILHEALDASATSQRELSKMLGVTEGRVSQVLSGEGNLYVSTLARYLRAMGYQLDIGATAFHASLPAIGQRRRRRRVNSESERYDAFVGFVSHNGADSARVIFTEPGAPIDSPYLVSPRFVGQVASVHGVSLRILRGQDEVATLDAGEGTTTEDGVKAT